MGRLTAWRLAIVVLASCTPSEPVPVPCMADVADAGTSACALPSALRADEVTNWEEFLATASALVCRASIEQDLHFSLTDSWCHPRFAALYVLRNTEGLPLFPALEARACLEQLEQSTDALNDGLECLALLRCAAPGACCPQRAGEGDGCGTDEDCVPWLACDEHVCRPRRSCPADPCPYLSECVDGRCVRVNESCGVACPAGTGCRGGECVAVGSPAAECRDGESCFGGTCGCGGPCTGTRPIGCRCTSDDECPVDVSVCAEGICTARPMLGETCNDTLRCFASACVDGVCHRIPEGGQPCVMDAECDEGLACGTVGICRGGLFGPTTCSSMCVTPTVEGGPCARGLACTGDLACRGGVCRRIAPGDPCESYECSGIGNCIDGACAAFPSVGEPCDDRTLCAPAMACVSGTCRERGGLGASCGETEAPCAVPHLCVEGICRTRPHAGEPCDAVRECAGTLMCVEGTCRATAAIGEPCGTGLCGFDALCSGGVCVRLAGNGGACVDGACALGAQCVDGTCYGRVCR